MIELCCGTVSTRFLEIACATAVAPQSVNSQLATHNLSLVNNMWVLIEFSGVLNCVDQPPRQLVRHTMSLYCC